MKWLVYLVVGIVGLLAGAGAGNAWRKSRDGKHPPDAGNQAVQASAVATEGELSGGTNFEELLALHDFRDPLGSAKVLVEKIDSLDAADIERLISESTAKNHQHTISEYISVTIVPLLYYLCLSDPLWLSGDLFYTEQSEYL